MHNPCSNASTCVYLHIYEWGVDIPTKRASFAAQLCAIGPAFERTGFETLSLVFTYSLYMRPAGRPSFGQRKHVVCAPEWNGGTGNVREM